MTPPPGPRKEVPDAARLAAYDCVLGVARDDTYANLALPTLIREAGITGRDAAFATELAYGTLRGQGTYDAVLAECASRPLADVDVEVRTALRLGAHQLLAMRVPPHAAVGATVGLARYVLGQSRAGFVNAVLRRVGERDLAAWLTALAPPLATDPAGHLALHHSHPRWVVEELAASLGVPLEPGTQQSALDPLVALLRSHNVAPLVSLVARPGRADPAELLAAPGAVPGRWSPYAVTLAGGGSPADIPAVTQGRAGVQDEGSQLVAIVAASLGLEGRDARWLDLCAGPGGKAALLASLAVPRGARLTANEVAPHRADLVRRVVGGDADVTVEDGRAGPWEPETFDRVLVDAPCTGLGALRRRPEARWRRQRDDLPGLVELQQELLHAAVELVRPGGLVIYATCSPALGETREVLEAVVARRGGLEPVDVRPALAGVEPLGAGPDVQLWTHLHGTDSMYVAALRRS